MKYSLTLPFNEERLHTILDEQVESIEILKMKVAALKTLNHNLNKIGLSKQYWPSDPGVLRSEPTEREPENKTPGLI
jgi:hypothetical protein